LTLIIDEKTKMDYERIKGHVYLSVQIVCEGSTDEDKIDFLYDTGAYLTVINRNRYEWFGLHKLPRKAVTIGGYNGSTDGYMFQIPGLKIGNRLLSGVWAFTPKSKDIKQNLLGDNIIEYFRPFQDNLYDCIYFIDNPTPAPYVNKKHNFTLACDNVLFVDGEI